jgi:hypothetical protein
VEGNSPRDFISGYFVEFGGLLVELLLGDYNGNDRIEQADLDLVLLSWGSDVVPENWIRDLPSGPIDQEELDTVLLGWGNVAANGAASVPEPSTLAVLVISLVVLTIRRRLPQVSRPSALATISDKM